MAFAAWLIWINSKKQERIMYIYFIHLLVNASWSVVFFALHQIFLALLVIVVIILLVAWLIKLYYPINKFSAVLMVPYLVWLGFAFALNLNILLLN
jgi:translocator protein